MDSPGAKPRGEDSDGGFYDACGAGANYYGEAGKSQGAVNLWQKIKR